MRRKLKTKIGITKKAMGPPALALYFFVFCKFYLGLMSGCDGPKLFWRDTSYEFSMHLKCILSENLNSTDFAFKVHLKWAFKTHLKCFFRCIPKCKINA